MNLNIRKRNPLVSRASRRLLVLVALGAVANTALAQPANDDCAAAIAVPEGTTAFSTTGATDSAPTGFGCAYPFRDIWYRYTPAADGIVTVSTCAEMGGNATFDTMIAIYPDVCPAVAGTAIACNDDFGGTCGLRSQVSFDAAAGVSYLLRLGGFNSGSVGVGVLAVSFAENPYYTVTYQGRLTNGGSPVTGAIDLQYAFFDAETGGTQSGPTRTELNVPVDDGLFTAALHSGGSLGPAGLRFLDLAIRSPAGSGSYSPITPRQRLTAAPLATRALVAETVVGAVSWSSLTDVPAGFADGADNDSGGDIWGVTAGTGLTGGGITGTVTLNVDFGGSGSATTVARSDHYHDALANSAGTILDALIVDAAGYIGIGSSTPDEKLEIVDSLVGGLTFPLKLENSGLSTNGTAVGLLFQADGGGDRGKGAIAYERTTTFNRGKLHFLQNSAGDATLADLTDAVVTVDNNGFVGLGTTAPVAKLHVAGDSFWINGTDAGGLGAAAGAGVRIANGAADSAIFAFDYATNTNRNLTLQNTGVGGGRVGIGRVPTANALEVAGEASKSIAGSWLANSDRRIKRDITTIAGALETLDKLRLVSFRYTDEYRAANPSIEDRAYLNVIAQEFAEVFPDWVKSSGEKLPDGSEILQVDTYPITIYTAAAVQELHRKLQQRDERIAALEARLERLEKMQQASASRTGRP